MSGKRKGLGKGLDALLSGSTPVDDDGQQRPAEPQGAETQLKETKPVTSPNTEASKRELSTSPSLQEVPVEYLRRGRYQPRKDMNPEALDELSESIRRQGIMQPIIVRQLGLNDYEIIAGERRWRAAQQVGLSEVPVLVKDISDEESLALALIENIQREDLNAMEEAVALNRLQNEFGYTQQQVAEAVGKPRSTVANLMRLTTLEPEVAVLLERGDIEMGHGRALLAVRGSEQIEAVRVVVDRGLSVRQTEALIRKRQQHQQQSVLEQKQQGSKSADINRLEQSLSETLGARVSISHNNTGKGKLLISYNTLDELDGILRHIK